MDIYDYVGKFIKKAIPVKEAELTIIKGMSNRVSTPKTPYVILQIMDDTQISSPEIRHTDQYKILWTRSEITMDITFIGNDNILALQMAKAFTARFNDAWASEQFEKYSDMLFPLYSENMKVEPMFLSVEGQFEDNCTINTHFEYHTDVGVCEDSAKEIIINFNNVE